MSKIIIIGANHAGTAAANTILDNYPENEVVIFDRNSNISYLGCGSALYIGRQIDGTEGLFYSSKEAFESKGAKVYMQTEVHNIDFAAKKVSARTIDGREIDAQYDELIIATGSLPIVPDIEGISLKNIEYVKLFQDSQAIDKALSNPDIKNVAVIGAGYIGVEMAEAVERRGKKTYLMDTEETCLSTYFDDWFTDDMNKNLADNSVNLHYNEKLEKILGNQKVEKIVTSKGEYEMDLVIMSIGFKPNTEMFKDNLKMLKNGALLVDRHQKTSIDNVFAIGDCASIYNNAKESDDYIALATNAVRSGIVAAHNACATPLEAIGVQGSNGISIYGYNMVSTGLNTKCAREAGFDAVHTDFEDMQKPEFMKSENHKVKIRIVYDKPTRRVLGAQIASLQDISMAIHMFSLAIDKRVTIEELSLLDIFFMPHFNKPYNYITMAALSASE